LVRCHVEGEDEQEAFIRPGLTGFIDDAAADQLAQSIVMRSSPGAGRLIGLRHSASTKQHICRQQEGTHSTEYTGSREKSM